MAIDFIVLDQTKIRIGPNDGCDTDFLVKRVGEIVCGGYTEDNPCPEKKGPGHYTLQKDGNNHWLRWIEDSGGCWRLTFRYPPRDEEFIRALKTVLESIITIIP